MEALIAELVGALGEARVKTGQAGRALYRKDASNMEGGASVICLPDTTDEVQACVVAAGKHGVPFVARGSGTGLSGGAVPVPTARWSSRCRA